jgi:low affinity Fe/Cu permease
MFPQELFTRLAGSISRHAGHPMAFGAAAGFVVLWLLSGPLFHWSDSWQLVINTGTTIVTFLMVFLIQSTQNRDTEALHLKIDELIRVNRYAHNALLDLEELSEAELDAIKRKYTLLARAARDELRRGRRDTGVPRVQLRPRESTPTSDWPAGGS